MESALGDESVWTVDSTIPVRRATCLSPDIIVNKIRTMVGRSSYKDPTRIWYTK